MVGGTERAGRGRVIVAGGSIAGLFVGAVLRRQGFVVDVFERSAELAPNSWFPVFRARSFGQGKVEEALEVLPAGMPPSNRLNTATWLRLNDLPVPDGWIESSLAELEPEALMEEADFYAWYEAVLRDDTEVIDRINADMPPRPRPYGIPRGRGERRTM